MKKSSLARAAVAVAAAAALVLTGCSASSPGPSDDAPHTLNVGILGAPQNWDPAALTWVVMIAPVQAAYDSLIHRDASGAFVPGLATEWEYTSPTEFRMKLRSGVTFTDGAVFDAEAVKANIEHSLESSGPYTSRLDAVSSVETEGDDTVILHLSEPSPSLPLAFANTLGMMASPAVLESGEVEQHPVGAGPYSLDPEETVANDHYTFIKNPDYWDADNIAYDTIVMRVIPDTNAIFSAIQSGQIDMGIGTSATAEAAKSGDVQVLSYTSSLIGLLLLDRDGKMAPALGEQKVRQALNYAIDRETIAGSVVPGRPTAQMFAPGQIGYDEDLDDYYAFDLDKAKRLLAEAGYGGGFTVSVLSTPGTSDTLIQAIAADWAKIGVTVEIDSKAPTDYSKALFTGADPIAVSNTTPTDSYLDAQQWLVEAGSQNIFKTRDDQIESLWRQGASESDEERDATYRELSERTVELAWFAPVVQVLNYWYYSDSVTGVEQTVGESFPFIYNWRPAE